MKRETHFWKAGLLVAAMGVAHGCTMTEPTPSVAVGMAAGPDTPSRGLSTITYVGNDGCTYQDELHNGEKFRTKRLSC